MLRKITALAVVLLGVLLWTQREGPLLGQSAVDESAAPESRRSDPAESASPAQQWFDARDTGRMLRVSGVVERTLSDDRDGSRHQRFILRLPSGQTLLVSHNIDLAPRLDGLARGDALTLHGQYEWNDRGGVLHWTHHDPDGRHPGGHIQWRGRRYE